MSSRYGTTTHELDIHVASWVMPYPRQYFIIIYGISLMPRRFFILEPKGREAACLGYFYCFNTLSLRMKGRWACSINVRFPFSINVWFPFMYSQKWNCGASLFPKQNYNVLSPKSYTHTYIYERFIYFQDRSAYFAAAKYVDLFWKYINRSQTHECRNWDWGREISFLGIHKLDFP
jgi:hypothetical protein